MSNIYFISEEKFRRALKDAVENHPDEINFFDDFNPNASSVNPANFASGISDAPAVQKIESRTNKRPRKKIAAFVSIACALLLITTFVLADPAKLFVKPASDVPEVSEEYKTEVLDLTVTNAGENYEDLRESFSSGTASYYPKYYSILENRENAFAGEPPTDSLKIPVQSAPDISSGAKSDAAASPSYITAQETDFSKTNNQTEGVEEADIIKTDGSYIYTLNNKALHIVKANDENPESIARISQYEYDEPEGSADEARPADPLNYTSDYRNYFEMYITKDRLVLIGQGEREPISEDTAGDLVIDPVPGNVSQEQTRIDIYDISDHANPKLINRIAQDGTYTSSRMVGDDLYLLSEVSYYWIDYDENALSSYVPVYEENGKYTYADTSDILMITGKNKVDSQYYNNRGYTMISGISIKGNGSFVSKKALYGLTGTVYSSLDNIYVASEPLRSYPYPKEVADSMSSYSGSSLFTNIFKLSVSKGKVNFEGAIQVEGYLNDQFSMDEYRGVFRVVMTSERYSYRNPKGILRLFVSNSTRFEQSTALLTFNKNLKQLGVIENIAPDEQVYSCRFMEDVAYVVTFRQVDPLFSIDLSNPKEPKILGELKIPGFSDYLHPYGDNMLFGIGRDADEETGSLGGVKLSMFDISDKTNVTEEDVSILNNVYYTQVSENHKAILVNSDRDIIAFPAGTEYYICSYSEGDGFTLEKKVGLNDSTSTYSYYGNSVEIRGLFIGDYFYIISPNTVAVFDMMDDYKLVGSLTMDEGAYNASQYPSYYGYVE